MNSYLSQAFSARHPFLLAQAQRRKANTVPVIQFRNRWGFFPNSVTPPVSTRWTLTVPSVANRKCIGLIRIRLDAPRVPGSSRSKLHAGFDSVQQERQF